MYGLFLELFVLADKSLTNDYNKIKMYIAT